jgi:hypothetical protein
MGMQISGSFATRRDVEMAIEHLVQEYGFDRPAIFIESGSSENTAGEELGGADLQTASPSHADRDDAALNGVITLSIEIDDDSAADRVEAALREYGVVALARRH